ncbi:MAG: ABC transporter permease [Candidatus Acidiferrum sp.]
MREFRSQLKQVFRRLGRAPMFTAITLITLAAGVGGNTVVFSVLEGVLLKPLPYPHSEDLVGVWQKAPGLNIQALNIAPSTYFIFREQNKSFIDVGVYNGDSVSITGVAEPEQVSALDVTDGTLPLLGVNPILGRTFSRQDDSAGAPLTAVLTYGYWRRKFSADPAIIGRTIIADGKPRQIIGVLPKTFHFLDRDDITMIFPMQWDRNHTNLGNYSFRALARLKPGVTLQQANTDIDRLQPVVLSTFPAPPGFSLKLFETAQIGPNIHPLKEDVVGDVGNTLWILMASIGMVLLIACANVANLLLVRVEGRRQELAVRAAIGATRGRIAAELLLESVVLGLLGSVLGLGFAYAAIRLLVALAPAGLPRIHDVTINGPVLLFTLLVSLFASALFGCIPVLKYAGVRLNAGIREGGRAISQSREQHRARGVLVVVQVALALVLLICSGLMIRTFRALTTVDPGFSKPAEVQAFDIYINPPQVPDREQVVRMDEAILNKIKAIPGVSSVSWGAGVPMDGNSSNDPIFVAERTYSEGELPPLRRFKRAAPGFLETLGTPLIAGRLFTWADTYQHLPVAVVSENFAREYWPNPADALGKRIRVATTDDWREIVGVVADVFDDGVSQHAPTTIYWPVMRNKFEGQDEDVVRGATFAIRTSRAGSENLMKDVREAVWSINPNLPLSNVNTLDYYYRRSIARTSFTLIILGVAGSMALLLGVVGIYGVIAYSVSQRTREIGIRMALGAQTQTLTGMFVRHGMRLTGIGVAFGVVTSIVVMRLMSSLLFKVSPMDPFTYVAVCAGLLVPAWLASYVPSRRVATVDPVEALRTE